MYVVAPTEAQKAIEDKFRRKAMKEGAPVHKTRRDNGFPKPDGSLIRKLMNQAGMKPRNLCEKVGVDGAKIQLIFRGVGTERPIIERIADVFEIEPKHIIKKR